MVVVVCAALAAIAIPFALSMALARRSSAEALHRARARIARQSAAEAATVALYAGHPSRERAGSGMRVSGRAAEPGRSPGVDGVDELASFLGGEFASGACS